MPKKSTARQPYSQRFLEQYGRQLQPDEIQLVQGYRALTPEKQQAVLTIIESTIIRDAQERTRQ